MVKLRNRLLILLALLTVALLGVRGVANATIVVDYDPHTNSFTGEPDTPSVKKTSATIAPGDETASVITKALWFEWASRIWAAMYLGVGR